MPTASLQGSADRPQCHSPLRHPSPTVSPVALLRDDVCVRLPLFIPHTCFVPRKPVLRRVLSWWEADRSLRWMPTALRGLPAGAEMRQEKKREKRKRKSTKKGPEQDHVLPRATRHPSLGPGPTRKRSTLFPVPIGRCGGRGGCAGGPSLCPVSVGGWVLK